MRLVLQTIAKANLTVPHHPKVSVEKGLIVYVGFSHGDTLEVLPKMVDKLLHLRIFPDDQGKTNWTLDQHQGQLLLVPNFTLYGDVSSSRRPSFSHCLPPKEAALLFQQFVALCQDKRPGTQAGYFGEDMHIEVVHQGPFTMVIEV